MSTTSDQTLERAPSLAERGQVLGFAVPVGMTAVGRAAGDPDREERQEGGDEVGAGVNRLGYQPEAPGREPGTELQSNERASRSNGNKSSAPLRSHPRKAMWRGTPRPWHERACSGVIPRLV